MISKERLQNLAKKGIPVYAVTNGDVLKIKTRNSEAWLMGNYVNWVVDLNGRFRWLNAHLDNIYETKEDAEFAKEFKNITRTVTLTLPTFEELQQIGKFEFKSADGYRYDIFIVGTKKLILTGIIENKYTGESTKENYIKLCKIAKKLFLGEKIDD